MTTNIGNAWAALETALKKRAPRLLADLADAASALDLAAVKPLPAPLIGLYKRHDGQRREHRDGLFRQGYFLPLRGPDSVENERRHRPDIIVFAKDFGGSWVGFVTNAKVGFPVGTIVALDDDAELTGGPSGPQRVADDLGTFLKDVADDIAEGRTIDERRERTLTVSFPFGGPRPRVIQDAALTEAGVTLEILDTSKADWTPSPFESQPFPGPSRAIFMRCSKSALITEPTLELEGESLSDGHGSGPIVIDGETVYGSHYVQASGVLPSAWQQKVTVKVTIRILE